jgi:hypothetical protein
MSATQTSADRVRDFLAALPTDSHYVVTTWTTQDEQYGKPADRLRECIAELRDCARDKAYQRITVLVLCDEEVER